MFKGTTFVDTVINLPPVLEQQCNYNPTVQLCEKLRPPPNKKHYVMIVVMESKYNPTKQLNFQNGAFLQMLMHL